MSFQIIISDEISHRGEFNMLANWRGLMRALEIGTDRGCFAIEFLKGWQGHQLVCIDPYLPYPEMPWNRDADFHAALQRLNPWPHARLIRQTSSEYFAATDRLRDQPIPGYQSDFIYIDGAHDEESVRRDILMWWSRVSSFGILAGHDFDQGHPGVVAAVIAFAQQEQVIVRITHDEPASWYIYRYELPPEWRRVPAPDRPAYMEWLASLNTSQPAAPGAETM